MSDRLLQRHFRIAQIRRQRRVLADRGPGLLHCRNGLLLYLVENNFNLLGRPVICVRVPQDGVGFWKCLAYFLRIGMWILDDFDERFADAERVADQGNRIIAKILDQVAANAHIGHHALLGRIVVDRRHRADHRPQHLYVIARLKAFGAFFRQNDFDLQRQFVRKIILGAQCRDDRRHRKPNRHQHEDTDDLVDMAKFKSADHGVFLPGGILV